MSMSLKELGLKYGFEEEVHFVILDKDIEQMLASDGITSKQPDYSFKKLQAIEGLQELYGIFANSLHRVASYVRNGLSPQEIRVRMSKCKTCSL